MWCLETIVAINQKVGEGKTREEAYEECGIVMADRTPKKNLKILLAGITSQNTHGEVLTGPPVGREAV